MKNPASRKRRDPDHLAGWVSCWRSVPLLLLLFTLLGRAQDIETKYIKLGMTKTEILSTLGPPIRMDNFERLREEIWYYNRSSVTFKDGKIIGVQNGGDLRGKLEISLGEPHADAPPFTLGSSKETVLAVQGSPDRMVHFPKNNMEIWWYNASTITFRGDKVEEWLDASDTLNVSLGTKKENGAHFSLGSGRQDVIDSQGTPQSIKFFPPLKEEVWFYGFSSVTFRNDTVVSWNNVGDLFLKQSDTYRGMNDVDGDPNTDEVVESMEDYSEDRGDQFRGMFMMDKAVRDVGTESSVPDLFKMDTQERETGHTVYDVFQKIQEEINSSTGETVVSPIPSENLASTPNDATPSSESYHAAKSLFRGLLMMDEGTQNPRYSNGGYREPSIPGASVSSLESGVPSLATGMGTPLHATPVPSNTNKPLDLFMMGDNVSPSSTSGTSSQGSTLSPIEQLKRQLEMASPPRSVTQEATIKSTTAVVIPSEVPLSELLKSATSP